MKKIRVLFAVMLVVLFAMPVMAAKGKAEKNSVTVSGDMAKDGHVVIAINWVVDSAKYPGLSREAMRAKIKKEIWNEMDDMVIALAKDSNVSVGAQNFTIIKENQDLLQQRPDGTKVYALKVDVQFDAVPAAPAAVATKEPAPKKESKGFVLEQHWNNAF